jgi:hypothetical protein
MNGAALGLFLLLYVVLITSLIVPVTKFFGWPQNVGVLYVATFLFSLGGAGLAWVFLRLKRLSSRTQRYIKIGVFAIYPLVLAGTYFIFGLDAFFTLCLFLLQLLFVLVILALPFIFTFGMLKKLRVALIAPGVGVIWLFILTLIIPDTGSRFLLTPDEPWSFILLFIGYLAFFELAMTTLYFSLTLQKMTAENHGTVFALERFSRVIDSYAVHYVVAMAACFAFTGGIVLLADLLINAYPPTVVGVPLGSLSGILFSVAIMVVSLLLFWLFSPLRLGRKQRSLSQKKQTITQK